MVSLPPETLRARLSDVTPIGWPPFRLASEG